jgi:membrane-bound lytic murein transglycosylase B
MVLSRRTVVLGAFSLPSLAYAQTGFDSWVASFKSRARSRGISQTTIDAAFANVRYNAEVVERDRNQAEFQREIWDYLDLVVSDSRVSNGRQAFRENRSLLTEIENRFGVPAPIVCAIWGMESAYGARRGDIPVIEALATLAYDGRRGRFFEQQLMAALRILEAGHVRSRNFAGSWAGAMGHTQFIPTSFEAYAVDFRGDGRRDIWSDDPTDALASTAAYLARFNWRRGMPWGVEVRIPSDFNFARAGRGTSRMPSEWARQGVVGVDGSAVPDYGSAGLLLPAGARGVALMTFANFRTIERYNASEAYVIGVGHLADRIAGGGPFVASWPRGDRGLTSAEVAELQRRLNAAGFNAGVVDGRPGPQTRAALRTWQRSVGLPADGRPTLHMLERLR